MDDWQDAAFSSRHMHNRVNRNGARGGGGKGKRNAAFDIRKIYGSYECKCPAWHNKINNSSSSENNAMDRYAAVLELYRLTENGQGVVGELLLPGVLRAAVVLAASRKSLQGVLAEFEPAVLAEDEKTASDLTEEQDKDENEDEDEDEDEDEKDEDEEEDEEEPTPNLFKTFEKNSFREPKFWLQWNGSISSPTSTEDTNAEKAESGLGYIIFTSNDCRKFKGTLNCASLGWKDVLFSGHKIAPRSESDIPVAWGRDGVAM
jgi:hypothetical protein